MSGSNTNEGLRWRYGRSIGLNADWCVDAWAIGQDLYVTDDEDGHHSIVMRWEDNEETVIEEVQKFETFEDDGGLFDVLDLLARTFQGAITTNNQRSQS